MSTLVDNLAEALTDGDENLKQALEQQIFTPLQGSIHGAPYKEKLVEPQVTTELMRILESPDPADSVLHDMLRATIERHNERASKGRIAKPRCYQCDGCLTLQHGEAVFKCGVCPNLVLCGKCEPGHQHPMLYITSNTKVPRFFSATLGGSAAVGGNPAVAVHEGVCCDGCQQVPIWGPRYKCVICDNFELCSRCVLLTHPGHNSSHVLLKISTPSMAPDSFAIEIED